MVKQTSTELYFKVISPESKKLGKKIDLLKANAGYSQNALAIESQISQYFMHRIINGTCKVSISSLQKIAKVLKVRVKDLIDF